MLKNQSGVDSVTLGIVSSLPRWDLGPHRYLPGDDPALNNSNQWNYDSCMSTVRREGPLDPLGPQECVRVTSPLGAVLPYWVIPTSLIPLVATLICTFRQAWHGRVMVTAAGTCRSAAYSFCFPPASSQWLLRWGRKTIYNAKLTAHVSGK